MGILAGFGQPNPTSIARSLCPPPRVVRTARPPSLPGPVYRGMSVRYSLPALISAFSAPFVDPSAALIALAHASPIKL